MANVRPCFRCGESEGEPFYCTPCWEDEKKDALLTRGREKSVALAAADVPRKYADVTWAKDKPADLPSPPPDALLLVGSPASDAAERAAAAVFMYGLSELAKKVSPLTKQWYAGARWVNAFDLFTQLDDGAELRLADAPLICITDLGSESRHEYRVRQLWHFLSMREGSNLPARTIITTIYSLNDIEVMYGSEGPRMRGVIERMLKIHHIN